MNIPLNVLVDAAAQMKLLVNAAEPTLTNDEYRKALGAYINLHAEVVHITKQIKIEVTE